MDLLNTNETKLSKYHLVPMSQDYLNSIKVTISLQKQGRHDLTLIVGLDNTEFDLKSITSKLKKTGGSGGTCKEIKDKDGNKDGWVISIQGDLRVISREWLSEKLLINEMNIRVMGA